MSGANKEAGGNATGMGTPRRRRALIAGVNIAVLLLLLHLYLAYAVRRRQRPLYTWVKDTFLETYSLRVASLIWRQRISLQRHADDRPLLKEEETAARQLLARIEKIQPDHVVLLRSGEKLFGQIRSTDDNEIVMDIFDGVEQCRRTVDRKAVVFSRRLVIPPVTLRPRDARFLIDFADYNHYCLPPFLIASQSAFPLVQQLHLTLVLLEEEFDTAFAMVTRRTRADLDDQLYHVCFFANEAAFLRHAAACGAGEVINSVGFFRATDFSLFLYDQPLTPGGAQGAFIRHYQAPGRRPSDALSTMLETPAADSYRQELSPAARRTARHEGAHLLACVRGVFPDNAELPLWLTEGLAQYCESSPFGLADPKKLALLHLADAGGRLMSTADLLAVSAVDGHGRLHNTVATDIVYAQSWLLFRLLMTPEHRPRFCRWLNESHADTLPLTTPREIQRLMNTLNMTPSKLDRALRRQLAAGSAAAPRAK